MLGFSEGWAHFYAAYVKQHQNAYLPSFELPSKYLYDGDDPDKNNYRGEDHEMAIMQLFWDLYDDKNSNEFFDDVSLGINGLYNLLRVNPKNLVTEAWDYLSGTVSPGPNYLKEMTRYGTVFAEHGMGVKGLSSVASWQQGDRIPTFVWDIPKTMGGNFYLFFKYYVEFYDSQGNKILTSEDISTSSSMFGTQLAWAPSTQQWTTITQNPNVISDKEVYWVVRCFHVWPPSAFYSYVTTGPYWSNQVGKIEFP
jgi:hypothetical protein